MNPLANYTKKEFKQLTRHELKDVINCFLNEGNYDETVPNVKYPLAWFNSNYFDTYILIEYFNNWTK